METNSQKILTPNVFITNDYGAVRKFLTNKDYLDMNSLPNNDGKSFLISGKNNKYLQSLEMSYNFDSSEKMKLVLEFIDTDGNFEQEFFMTRINSIKSLTTRRLQEERLRKTSNLESNLVDLNNYATQQARIFIAFGVGSDLRNWSDIHVFNLVKTNLDLSNGLRKFTFTFYPSNNGLFRPKLTLNLNSPNPQREFLFTENIDGFYAYAPTSEDDTFERVVYKLMKSYISILTATPQENIIGVLPAFVPFKNFGNLFYQSTPSELRGDISIVELIKRGFGSEILDVFASLGIEYTSTSKAVNNFVTQSVTKRGMTKNVDIQTSQLEANTSNSLKDLPCYCIKSSVRDKSTKSELFPSIPDAYEPLNKINETIKSYLNTVDNLIVFEETNAKILDFFKDNGLIKNSSEKCIVFGFEQMINEYLYRNYMPLEEVSNFQQLATNILGNFKPTLQIMEGKEKEKTNNSNYGFNFINTISKKKTSSNFFEKTSLDELAIDELSSEFVKQFSTQQNSGFNLFEFFDIPIFTNNLKNSNVLDLQLTNSELYINAVTLSIRDNFSKFYLSQIQKNWDIVNIDNVSTSSIFDTYYKFVKSLQNGNLTNKNFFNKLQQIIAQQFLLAEDQKINLQEAIDNKNLFDVLGDITVKPTQVVGKKIRTDRGFIGDPGERAARAGEALVGLDKLNEYETLDAAKLRLKNKLNYFYSESEVKEILKDAKEILKGFERLIVKNGGDVNIEKYLLAQAVRITTEGENSPRELITVRDKETKALKVIRYKDSLAKEERLFEMANVLLSMFNVQFPNEDGTKFELDKVTGLIFSPKNFGLSQELIAAELFKYLNQHGWKINLKTLPFFHLSSFRTMTYKPCFLFSKKILMQNSRNELVSNNLDFFSGMYNIAAFKHVITTTECYSQFMLQKSLGTDYNS